MTQRSVTSSLDRLPSWAYFLLLFTYLVLMTFQGIDMADEGFNSIFFQQIYNDPGTVQYSFMFWLAGVVGGAFEFLFPNLGFLGFRLLGAVVMMGTVIVTYQLLKNYLRKPYLMIGLALALLIVTNNIRIFHYNYLCTFWFMSTASLLFTGLRKNSLLRIFLAGAIVTLEVFTRIPSLVNLGLIIAILYHAYLTKAGWAKPIKQSIVFIGGFIVSLGAVLFIMSATGQLAIFKGAMNLVVEMGKGGEGSHYGISKLIRQFFLTQATSLKISLLIFTGILAAILSGNYLRDQWYYRKWMGPLLSYGVALVFLALIITNRIDHMTVLFVLTNICLFSGVILLTSERSVELRVLMLIGCYIILTYPLGSSDGILTVGIYTLWLALPIATHLIFSVQNFDNKLSLAGEMTRFSSVLQLNNVQLARARNYIFGLLFFAVLYQAYYYPFFDTSDRRKMTYAIDNKYMRGIFTTQSRATAINELLVESVKYVKPGDRVLAYHSIPMFHYMTETKPFLRNSMPWLYEGGFFKNELNQTAEQRDTLPVIVRQLLKTVGDASNWPDPPAKFDENWATVNAKRDQALDEFIKKYGYTEVWKNSSFSILIPGSK